MTEVSGGTSWGHEIVSGDPLDRFHEDLAIVSLLSWEESQQKSLNNSMEKAYGLSDLPFDDYPNEENDG